jgi:glycosyltransferase involved in cell wall biosynthesis
VQQGAESAASVGRTALDLSVLVVGTFGGGGIHHYVDTQVEQLDGYVDVDTHDMGMPPVEAGPTRLLQGLLLGLAGVLRFCGRSRPDVVHVHTSHSISVYRSAFYVCFAKHVWGVPVILHVHGSSFDEFVATDSSLVAAVQRRVFAATDTVIVLSEYWKDVVARRTAPEKIRVLPNGVEVDAFTADPTAETPHVVYVSNLMERKGVAELVTAVDRLCERGHDVRVSIAGDGPLSAQVEALAEDRDAVTYLGYVSEAKKRSLLADGSIYVLPTYAEGLPIAMLEGMAGGNAIVSTAVGSIPEVIDDERGLLVQPGNADDLLDALETLVTDAERRQRMARANRRAVEAEYSWAKLTDELLSIYETYA